MKATHKRLLPIIAVAILVGTLAWQFWPQQLVIDESWWIVYNTSDRYDEATAQFLLDEYGAADCDIDVAGIADLNVEELNLLFIGGSNSLSAKVPWINPHRPWLWLTVDEPEDQPDCYFYYSMDDPTRDTYIKTPHGLYYCKQDREIIHDYGLITKSYDQELRRWIIISIGFSAECTASGAKILIEDLDQVRQHSWLVYEYTAGPVALEDWNLNKFEYVIVDSG